MKRAGIVPEADFFDDGSRKLQFATNHANISLIRVRSFDVPTFVSRGGAQLGIAGSDVLMEFDYPDVYAPLDLGIGHCRLSLAEPVDAPAEDLARASHVRIATKYPRITAQYFARSGIQAECIKLNGAMELAPKLGLARRIVDLVSTGRTLKENGLHEVAVIAQVSSRLIINRTAFKTIPQVATLLECFREAIHGA
jgi:ATP phosphoribosyltransferase